MTELGRPESFSDRSVTEPAVLEPVTCQFRVSSSPGGSLPRGPHQIRTWRFPPSGSSADVARGSRATTVRSCGDMIRRRRSAGHGSLRTITPTRAAFARPGPGGYPFPGVIARMQPSDSLIPIGLGSGRPLPSAYPGARATRSNEGLPGVRAVLFQRAVVVDPAGCGQAPRGAHGLARVSSAASPAARHPTSGTIRGTHRASPRTPPATGPTRSGIRAAYGAPRRHTMPSAQAVVKRGGGAGRTSVSQSWKVTGHFVRLHLRPRCPGRGDNRRIL